MQKFTFSPQFIRRFKSFLDSKEYHATLPGYAKTEYWQEHADLIKVEICGNTVTLDGASGYTIPPLRNKVVQTTQRMRMAVRNPALLMKYIKRELKRYQQQRIKQRIKLLCYEDAFDAVMSHDPIAEILPVKQQINFKQLDRHPLAISNIKEMKERSFARDKYSLNWSIINTYYLWNILCTKADINKIKCVLEIGAGTGNFSALLWHNLKSTVLYF